MNDMENYSVDLSILIGDKDHLVYLIVTESQSWEKIYSFLNNYFTRILNKLSLESTKTF